MKWGDRVQGFVVIPAMASRQLLPRLLRPVTRSVTSRIITPGYVAHPEAPQTHHVLRPFLLSDYSYASTSIPLGFRGLSSCSLFPNSASLLIPRYCSEVHMVRRVGDGVSVLPGTLHVRVLGTLTLNPYCESFEVKFDDYVAKYRVILLPGSILIETRRILRNPFVIGCL